MICWHCDLRILIALAIFVGKILAEVIDPVRWSMSYTKINLDTYLILINAEILDGWAIYDMENYGEEGPLPTSIKFHSIQNLKLVGELIKPSSSKHYDKYFETQVGKYYGKVSFQQKAILLQLPAILKVDVEYMACDSTRCIPPEIKTLEIQISSDSNLTEKHRTDGESEVQSSTTFFLTGLLAGMLGVFTPCVLPMIPLTIAQFANPSVALLQRFLRGGWFGLSIIIIFIIFGLGITRIFGVEILNEVASSPISNAIFFLLFFLFGLSLLGAFDIRIPSGILTFLDKLSKRAGFIGITFLSIMVVLGAFACIGPLLGAIIVEGLSSTSISKTFFGILGFGCGLAIPFMFFSIVSGFAIKNVRSGDWANKIKKSLGYVLLLLSVKYLFNVDIVLDLQIISREVFLAIWIGVCIVWFLNLSGILRDKEEVPKITTTTLILMILLVSFIVYLFSGFFGNPLRALSGYLPPEKYSERITNSIVNAPYFSHSLSLSNECVANLPCYTNYYIALEQSQKELKPLLVYFSGVTCTNCKKMESTVFSSKKVRDMIQENFILAYLYTDLRKTMPPEDLNIYKAKTGKEPKNIGEAWRYLEIEKFGTNSLPYFVIVDANENVLVKTGYTSSTEEFITFLDKGLSFFKNQKSL